MIEPNSDPMPRLQSSSSSGGGGGGGGGAPSFVLGQNALIRVQKMHSSPDDFYKGRLVDGWMDGWGKVKTENQTFPSLSLLCSVPFHSRLTP